MKKILLYLIFAASSSALFSQGSENFNNLTVGSSYVNGSFTNTSTNITWSYVASRDGNGDANNSGITLPALMLRRSSDNSRVSSSSIAGGIGDFSMNLYKGFTGAGSRQVQLLINGTVVATSTSFDNFSAQTFTVNNIDISGNFTMEIRNNTTSQIIVDNITWTGFASAGNQAPVITDLLQTPSDATVTSLQAVTVSSDVTDDAGLSSVKILYDVSTNGMFSGAYGQEIIMTANGNDYTGDIPAQANGSRVFYVVQAIDNDMTAMLTTTSAQFSYTVQDPVSVPVIVNEMSQGNGGAKEWVELLVIEDNLDMRGYELGDNDDGNFTSFVTFTNDANWASVPAGTLIVVYNAADKDDILMDDADFSDNVVVLPSDNATYFTGTWASFGNSDADDAAAIRDNNDVMIHDMAVTHPTATITAPGSGQAKAYLGASAVTTALATTSNWQEITASAATPGTGNSLSNTVYINTLLGVTSYVYDGAAWTPQNPEMNSTNIDNVIVQAGIAALVGDIDASALIIVNGATLNAGANSVNLARDINVYGTLVAEEATINLAGTQLQTIAGNEFSLENLILNNGSGLAVNAPVNLEGVLTLTNGAITTNDNLTFKSTATTTAAVAPVLSGSVSGNVTVEQFYPAMRAFRFFSSPLNMNGSILNNWQQNGLNAGDAGYEAAVGTHITGGTLANGFDQSGSNAPSAFTYNNSTQTWMPFANTTTSLNAGDAARIFVRGDRSTDLFSANVAPSDTTIKTTGSLAIGNVTYTNLGANANEFSFLGNPYVAQVDMVQVMGATGTQDVNKQFYYAWDPTVAPQGAYVTYDLNALSSNNMTSEVSQFLQPGQSFFVETLEDGGTAGLTPVVTFQEAFKSTDVNTTATYSTPSASDRIVLSLFNNADQSLKARDGVVVNFDTTGNNAIDQYDARKLQNLNVNMGIVVNGTTLSIESRAYPVVNEELTLDLNQLTTGNYSFQALVDWNSTLNAILVDRYTSLETMLNAGSTTINFDVDTSQSGSIASNRFYVKFTDGTLSTGDVAFAEAVKFYPNPTNGEHINISGLSQLGDVFVEMHNISGQRVYSTFSEPLNGKLRIDNLPTLNKGVYLLKITQNSNVAIRKMIIN